MEGENVAMNELFVDVHQNAVLVPTARQKEEESESESGGGKKYEE